jgi:cell division septation protein DedD
MGRPRLFRALGWLAVAGLVVGALVGPTVGGASAAISGAIWTSTSDGSAVNANVNYALKTDVYLNGGPQHCSGSGLPDGLYYFQVTDPSGGALLSTDAISARQVKVVNGVIAGVAGTTGTHAQGTAACGVPVQLSPYNDTTNNGNEYSVDLAPADAVADCNGFNEGASKTLNFVKGCDTESKNDNFKVGATIATSPPTDPPTTPPTNPPTNPPTTPPTNPPTTAPTSTPTTAPTSTPAAATEAPTGGVEAATGTPGTTPPPTDSPNGRSSSDDSVRAIMLAIAGLIAVALLLTPASIVRRRR